MPDKSFVTLYVAEEKDICSKNNFAVLGGDW